MSGVDIYVFDCFVTHAYDTFAEPGDKVAIDEPIAQIETDKVFFFSLVEG